MGGGGGGGEFTCLFRSIVHGQHRVHCSKTAPARWLGINVEWERTEGSCPHQARGISPEGDLCNETSGATCVLAHALCPGFTLVSASM